MSKVTTIVALVCFLIVGAAAASILARDSIPAATAEMTSSLPKAVAANRVGKADRLDVAMASVESAASDEAAAPMPDVSAPLRQAFAAATAADIPPQVAVAPEAPTAVALPSPPAKPKAVARPQPQKSYALLSEGQIAGIRERLRLSSSQEYYWPAVETALRNVARRIQANRLSNPRAAGIPIDPDSEEVQELKSAAMPLLFQLRDDQKEEVRKLARIIGLEQVAEQI